jgi:TonB family protein
MKDPKARVSQDATAAAAAEPGVVRQPGFLSEQSILLADTRRSLRGAFGVSVVTHVGIVLLAYVIARTVPMSQIAPNLPDLTFYDIIWLTQKGPGGGGGGGGNKSPEPPRKIELPGRDQISVPVAKPVNLSAPEPPKAEPPPEQLPSLEIPAVALAAGTQTLPGTLDAAGAPSSQGRGAGGGAGTGTGRGIGPGSGPGLGPGSGGGTGGGVYRPGNGVSVPRILREVKPQYTADAMRAKIQGLVELEAVVLPDGSVGEVRVVRSLDAVFGLDQEAIKAVRQWRFVPGTRLGQPVAVLVGVELTFTLR